MIQRFFFNQVPHSNWPTLFRRGMGLLLLLTSIQLWPDFDILYGPASVIDHRLLAVGQGQSPQVLAPIPITHSYLLGYLICCLLLVTGIMPRLAAIALCVLHHQLYLAHPAFSYGFDYLAASALFYCIWFPVDKKSTWATPSLRVLQLHLCLLYFFGGLDKALGPTWRDGEALWKALQQPDFLGAFRPDIAFAAHYPLFVAILGCGVMLLELTYPVFIWLRPTQRLWLWGIVAMHVGIAVFMGLYHFSALMVLFNLCAFHVPYRKPPSPFEQIATPYHHPATRASPRTDPPTEMPCVAPKPHTRHI